MSWIDRIHKVAGKLVHLGAVKKLYQQMDEAGEGKDETLKGMYGTWSCHNSTAWSMYHLVFHLKDFIPLIDYQLSKYRICRSFRGSLFLC